MPFRYRKREPLPHPKQWLLLLERIPEAFLLVSLGAMVANHLYYVVYHKEAFSTQHALVELAPYVLVAVVLLFYKLINDVRRYASTIDRQLHLRVEVLEENENYPVAEMIVNCRKINILTLSGSIIVPLTKEETIRSLVDRHRRSEVTILIADPFSEGIIRRYKDDEPLTSQASIAGIENRILLLSQIIGKLSPKERERIHVGIYRNYPTISVFQGDNRIYFSYYGYKLRGDDTPTILTGADERLGSKLLEHFESIQKDATPIARWIENHYERLTDKNAVSFCEIYAGVFLRTADRKYIFQRRDSKRGVVNPGMLSVFGGSVEEKEDPQDAAQRELMEETGLRVNRNRFVEVKTIAYSINNYECMLDHYFVVDDIDPDTLTIREGTGIEIYTREEVMDRDDLTRAPRTILGTVLRD